MQNPSAASPAKSSFVGPVFRWSIAILLAVIAGAVVFEFLNISVFQRVGFAHSYCYLRDPKMIGLHVVSDILIGLAYVSISTTLAFLVYKASKDIPFHGVFLAFGLFIVSCGFTHFMEVWVVWQPVYWLSGYVKVVTAAASLATAVALFPLVPKIFAMIVSVKQAEARRREIEQLNQQLEQFNYSVAHDLRAPLRGVAGLSEALREDFAAQLPPEAAAYLTRMHQSVMRMDRMLTDLLQYASIGQRDRVAQKVPLNTAIAQAAQAVDADLRERAGSLNVPANLPSVIGDPTLLSVVFQNLFSNSVKFMPKDVIPVIDVTASIEGRKVIVLVSDNGIGIPAESRSRLFRMFERLRTDYPGTGIGLALVQQAVDRMNGSINIVDPSSGKGAAFRLELPAA